MSIDGNAGVNAEIAVTEDTETAPLLNNVSTDTTKFGEASKCEIKLT